MPTSLPKTATILALCFLFVFGVAACGGGGAEVKSELSTTTVGQQLLDLKKALDAGAITKDDYEKERAKILNR
jgi:hypothetical protein